MTKEQRERLAGRFRSRAESPSGALELKDELLRMAHNLEQLNEIPHLTRSELDAD